jgi:Predicted transcriptional regulator
MALKEMVRLLDLDRLLHRGRTGNARLLARKLGVSRSTLYRLFEELKSLGAEIEYDANYQSYFYRKKIKLLFVVGQDKDECLTINEIRKIAEGFNGDAIIQVNGE